MGKKEKSKLEKYVEASILYLIMLLIILLLIELFVALTKTQLLILEMINLFILIVFAVDLYYLYMKAPDWKYFLKHHWSDIIAIVPIVTISRILLFPAEEISGRTMLFSLFKILRVERILKIGLIERILESLKSIKFANTLKPAWVYDKFRRGFGEVRKEVKKKLKM